MRESNTMRVQTRILGVLLALFCGAMAHADDVTVYAAASLTNAMKDISAAARPTALPGHTSFTMSYRP